MKAFVTGATGFIGGNLVRALLADGHQVRTLVRPQSDRRNIAGLPIELAAGDLDDPRRLTDQLTGCDNVFHVAAHYSLWAKDRDAIYRANLAGTKNLLAAAQTAKIKRFIHTSSVAAIGVPPAGTLANEETQTTLDALVSDYKKSKFLAEQAAREAARKGLDVVIVNPSTPIGAHDVKPTPTGEIILRFLQDRMPAYVHTGLNLIDVDDVVRGHLLAWQKGRTGERYILGHRNLTLKEMLEVLAVITGKPAPRFAVPHVLPLSVAFVDEMILARYFGKTPQVSFYSVRMSQKAMYYDSSKAVRELGLPQSSIENAIEKAVRWFQANDYV
ncbi:MAG TPA: NAD-dependent epimerase/dehydratase family protein [Blastocatellia bacterium]|nr:NAD-dependent epimerase/dehydratase family protein [Blastocatellia bacterium]HMV82023.1 NAD-dependent epimerase/dehydratase family protein [Blastocatellia bacterium]HMX24025.1 NAD-dependent epimerase/dehydratase family protein [Blastocatellia bacterium]HMY70549.1 NAD-dependent epimerase/dehydratase family protein [Blastocatellia bacterium]HMZ18231.1 NAD-dependent epimerase/dehydratase family protein [Blastocatellia bacterium]